MATISDILTTPTTGYPHIDALLAAGPDWNFATSNGVSFRTTLYYSFDTSGTQYESGAQPFNAAQQAATEQILAYVAQLTGINFAPVPTAAMADLHFAVADIANPALDGVCYADYSYTASATGQLTSYTADAYIYLDAMQPANQAPVAGTWGYQALLHEVGHALGLKHPFEGTPTLAAPYQDDTAHTLMSYTNGSSCYSQFNEYDLAALAYLYGGDGLRGTWGVGTNGLKLIDASTDSILSLPAGRVILTDNGGNDTVVYSEAQAAYTIVPTRDKAWLKVTGSGVDHLISSDIEQFAFSDGTVATKTLLNPAGGSFFGSNDDDLLVGTPGNDVLYDFGGNDILVGVGGYDRLFGGSGLDTALFDEQMQETSVVLTDTNWTVSGRYGVAILTSVERLQFQDGKLALDLGPDQAAGQAARVATAAGGGGLLADQALMGELIGLFDSGETIREVCETVTAADWFRVATGGTDAGFVNLVYEHVVGMAPTAAETDYFVSLLQGHGGSMSQADLLVAAAFSQATQQAIDLVGLEQTGLAYW